MSSRAQRRAAQEARRLEAIEREQGLTPASSSASSSSGGSTASPRAPSSSAKAPSSSAPRSRSPGPTPAPPSSRRSGSTSAKSKQQRFRWGNDESIQMTAFVMKHGQRCFGMLGADEWEHVASELRLWLRRKERHEKAIRVDGGRCQSHWNDLTAYKQNKSRTSGDPQKPKHLQYAHQVDEYMHKIMSTKAYEEQEAAGAPQNDPRSPLVATAVPGVALPRLLKLRG